MNEWGRGGKTSGGGSGYARVLRILSVAFLAVTGCEPGRGMSAVGFTASNPAMALVVDKGM